MSCLPQLISKNFSYILKGVLNNYLIKRTFTICIPQSIMQRFYHESKFMPQVMFSVGRNPYCFSINRTTTQIHPFYISTIPSALWSNKIKNLSQYYFSSSVNNFSNKKSSIEGLHEHKPLVTLKSKKRIHRKNKRSVDETNEQNAEGFQIRGHHKFLTFDPEFAIPDSSVHRAPTREFQTIAYATAHEYELEKLSEDFHKQGLYVPTPIISVLAESDSITAKVDVSPKLSDPEDVLYLNAAYQLTAESRSIFVFREGSIVFWNVPLLERQNVLRFLKKHQSGSYSPDIIEEETETLIYTYTESSTRLRPVQNMILLNEKGDTTLEQYTFSNALAMSVKLGIWEASLDRYVENIEHVTEKLQESGIVTLSQEEVLQRMGQLFALRHLINLSSDLLDTPDFYWEHESLGNLYNKTANYLSISKRTSVMNSKLNHCLELMELLKSHLNERHSFRLEWIIIILIFIEVFFELIHLGFKATDKS